MIAEPLLFMLLRAEDDMLRTPRDTWSVLLLLLLDVFCLAGMVSPFERTGAVTAGLFLP